MCSWYGVDSECRRYGRHRWDCRRRLDRWDRRQRRDWLRRDRQWQGDWPGLCCRRRCRRRRWRWRIFHRDTCCREKHSDRKERCARSDDTQSLRLRSSCCGIEDRDDARTQGRAMSHADGRAGGPAQPAHVCGNVQQELSVFGRHRARAQNCIVARALLQTADSLRLRATRAGCTSELRTRVARSTC